MPDRSRSPATIRDIAARAGVSRMTVSRAINAPHRVSPETLARVEAAIAEAGYRPDPAARQLALGGEGSEARVVLAYPAAEESRLGAYLAACLAGARQAGMQLVPMPVSGAERGDREAMRLERLDPQALILLRGARAGMARALPACAIAAEPEGVAAVCVDEAAAAYDLAQRLIFLGHRRIGFAGDLGGSPTDRARFEGYARALHNFGLAVAPELVADAAPADAALKLTARIDSPSAVIACREEIAAACLIAAKLRGRGDTAICYFDDHGAGESGWGELSRATLPVEEMCRAAFRLLAERIECARAGRPAPAIRRILFPRAVTGQIARAPRRDQAAMLRRAHR